METSSNLFNDTIFVYNKLFQMKKDMAIIYINEYHGKYFYEWTIHNHSPILMRVFTKNNLNMSVYKKSFWKTDKPGA